ncbi:MAG: cation:proton antiporter [Acidobacteria bacterium]|nr:cation:proton antiporter [Acidobacteriota bacterium]
MEELIFWFALAAAVLILTALASGLVERSPLSFPLMFLGLGFLLGEKGLGWLRMDLDNVVLETVATLTLSLVLFLDAVKLRVREISGPWQAPLLILGPGSVLILSAGAGLLHWLLNFPWLVAFMGGAALASTDPVVLREILRDRRIPDSIRQVLHLEAGINDVIVLPVILLLIGVITSTAGGWVEWTGFVARLLLLGPAIGFVIGGSGSWAMSRIDARMGIREEHQALYGIGLVLAAYAAATACGGDGFLSAFAAGIAVVVLNQTLCECFLVYGETTAEMAMLLAFVLFGSVLSGLLDTVSLLEALLVAALLIFVVRPLVISLLLVRVPMSWQARLFLSWFGPRGLNSLLLVLLVVQAGVPAADHLLAAVGFVVFLSVVLHGGTATPVSAWYGRLVARKATEEERSRTGAGLLSGGELAASGEEEVPSLSPRQLRELLQGGHPPIVLDVRKQMDGEEGIPGSLRVPLSHLSEWALNQRKDRLIVAYCA